MRWRSIVICLLAAALVLLPAASAHALDWGVFLKATTIPGGGTSLLIDGQFTELWFFNNVPSYDSAVLNSTYVRRDNGWFLEVGRIYNASAIEGIPLRNPVGFIGWNVGRGYQLGFMDGIDHGPAYHWEPDIYFANGRWYGFELQRDRSGGASSDRWEVRVWDPVSNIWTHVAWWARGETGITSARGILGTERQSLGDPDYGTFYRSQYRTYGGPQYYYYWPGGAYDSVFRSNDHPPWNFYLDHIGDPQRWIYCNTAPI